jgi:hypothetical protein
MRGGGELPGKKIQNEPTHSRLGTYFFRKWGRGGRGPGASPGVPNPPPGPPRRLAARGGKGELCTALSTTARYEEAGFAKLVDASATAGANLALARFFF